MGVSGEQIKQFLNEGYLLAPRFFTEREVRAMRLELERLREEGALRNVTTDGDGKTTSSKRQNLQICPMHHKSSLYRALSFHPKVVDYVRGLIGDPVIRHLDQSFLKPARTGAPTNWHQDNAYFKISDPTKGTAMWIAIHDATIANGTLRVVPGSHKGEFEHSRDPESDHHIRCYVPEEQAVAAELEAGGVLFFCYGVAHATGANTTDKDRAGVAYHFLNGNFAREEMKLGETELPYVTGDKASGGEREYGVRVAGTWEQEVEKVLESRAGAAV